MLHHTLKILLLLNAAVSVVHCHLGKTCNHLMRGKMRGVLIIIELMNLDLRIDKLYEDFVMVFH